MSYPFDLNDLQWEDGEWANRTFPQSTPTSIVAHLGREARELVEETDPMLRREECADVVLLILHLAHKEGWSLLDEIRRKFAINQRRRWGEPDAEGVVEHLR